MMTHTLVQCIKHTCRGRMARTACPQMGRHIFLLTYHESTYPSVAPLALDVLSMPASEAYAKRVFRVCGYLSAGRRNRLSKNMERRVFLQMNSNILSTLYELVINAVSTRC